MKVKSNKEKGCSGHKARRGVVLPLLLFFTFHFFLLTSLQAQEVRVDYDEQCGCDIFFIDGIETTRDGDRYGFRREDGTVIAPNIYLYVGQFTNGYCKVILERGQYGVIDRDGRQVVPCIYDDVDLPFEGRVLVSKNGLLGYTDLNGEPVIPPQFITAGRFSDGCAPVMVRVDSVTTACTFIDTMGRMLFPPKFQNVQPYSCGFAEIYQGGRWGVMDHAGNVVLPPTYERMTTFFDTLFFAGDRNGMALFDKNMKPLTPFVYTMNGVMQDGRIPVQRNGKCGFLDRKGREVIPCIYDETGFFFLNRTMVREGNRFGIIDTAGRVILPIEYENTSIKNEKYVYYDSLALVEKNHKLGFVDLDGRLVIPLYYDDAYQFSEGLASVRYNGRWGYIDTRGDIFLPFVFDLASPYQWGRAEVLYNDEIRNVDRKGRCVKNCKGIIAWRDWNE